MSGRIFIDTNIVIYAHLANESEKHNLAINLLKKPYKLSSTINSPDVTTGVAEVIELSDGTKELIPVSQRANMQQVKHNFKK